MRWSDYQEVVEKIDGLNSISTLKKWRLKIERLTDYQFKEARVRTGRKSYSKVFLFDDGDLYKLQMIANLKNELGLDKAILKAYAPSRASPKPLAVQLKEASSQIEYLSDKLNQFISENKQLALKLESMERRLQNLEIPKKRTLFGK
ncbi:hypothetical protein [Streptococcus pluranimalium]|uniref:hypothetical protein n=1 Tax=Streptococcus pluranimalium TaxID=82348 RepID=UPI0039FBA427